MRSLKHTPISRRMWLNPIVSPHCGLLGFILLFLLASSQVATAQFNLVTGAGDPLNLVDAGARSVPVFVDLDNDCDKDLVVGNSVGEIKYYKNIGSASSPSFADQLGAFNPGTGLGNPFSGFGVDANAKPAFADVDADGDLDLFVGAFDGTIHAYKNVGTAAVPNFSEMFGPVITGFDGNPFETIVGIPVGNNASPAFLDIDGDGDMDCFVGRSQGTNSIRYFRNEGDIMNPVFTELTGAANPLSNTNHPINGNITSNATLTAVDMDIDGDLDIYVGITNGTFRYFRNNAGPTFTHFASGFGPLDTGTPAVKDINILNATDYSAPTFVDINADGDLDCFSGRSTGAFVFYSNVAATIPPVITCNPYLVNLSAAGTVTVDPALITPSSLFATTTFPCPANLTLSLSGATQTFGCAAADNVTAPVPSDGVNDGTTLTLTATDGVTTTTCSVNIFVRDVTGPAPDVSPLPNLVRDVCNLTVPVPTATDVCDGPSAPPTMSPVSLPTTIGTHTLTWTYTDSKGNTSTQTQSFQVVSNAPPTWNNCPALPIPLVFNTTTPSCGYDGTLSPAWSPIPNPIDCDPPLSGWNVTSNHTPTDVFPLGPTNVTYSAQDASGNVGYCNFTVMVTDGVPPTVTLTAPVSVTPSNTTVNCSGGTYNTTADMGQCGAIINWTGPGYTATDNCGGTVNVAVSNPSGSLFPIGSTIVSYTATDLGGTSTTFCTFTVTVTDDQLPTITCPGSLTVPTAPNLCTSALINLVLPAASDNCTTGLTVTELIPGGTNPRLEALPLGAHTFTYQAMDASGNTATCSFTITVTDQQAPTFGTTCPANQTWVANINTNCSYATTWATPTVSDNCSGATITSGPVFTPLSSTIAPTSTTATSGTFNEGTTQVSYTATDGAGNTVVCSFTIRVTNSTPPSITCPVTPVTVTAGPSTACQYVLAAIAGVSSTATLPCDPGVISYRNAAGAPLTIGTSAFGLGTYTLTAIATDVSGNSSTCSVTINVVDNLGPQLQPTTCPANITINSDAAAACGANVLWNSPVWVDNCSTSIYYNRSTTPVGATPNTATLLTTNSGGFFPVGTTIVNIVAKDGPAVTANLGTPCGFSVTVIDDDRPSITNCTTSPVMLSTTYPTCTASYTLLSPTITDNGCTTTYTVNYTVSAPSTTSGAYVPATPPTVTLNQGNNTITYTTSDAAGNTTSCVVVVQVKDLQGPVISCATLSQVVVTSTCTGVPFSWADAALGAVDCTGPVAINAPTVVNTTGIPAPVLSGTAAARTGTFPVGVTTLQYTAYDAAVPSNSSTCTFTIDVRENTPPTITCPTTPQVFAAGAGCSATITAAMLTAPTHSDNCASGSTVAVLSPTFPVTRTVADPPLTVVWVATDASTNTATCSRTIQVTDQTPPTLTCLPAIITVNLTTNASCVENGNNGGPAGAEFTAALSTITLNATDNCTPTSSMTIVRAVGQPGQYCINQNNYLIWNVTDGSGFTSTCSQQVIVNNTNTSTCTIASPAPLSVSTGQTVNLMSGVTIPTCCAAPTTVVQLTAGPGIPPAITVPNPSAYTFTTAGTYTATFTVTCTSPRGNLNTETTTIITFTRTINVALPCTATTTGITCAAPTTINVTLTGTNCSAPASSVAWGSVNVGDGCVNGSISGLTGTLGSITLTSDAPATFNSGTTTLVNFTATNTLGSASCQKTVIVAANPSCTPPAPTITINQCPPANTITEGIAIGDVPQLLASMISTTCTGTPTITSDAIDQFPGGLFTPTGAYTITWTVTVPGCTAQPVECFQDIVVIPAPISGCPWNAVNKEVVVANSGLSIDAPATGDRFGTSVDVEGDWAVSGAPWEDDGAANNNRGAAYILHRDAPGTNNWSIVKKLFLATGVTQDVFGESVAIDVTGGVPTVVIGARGRNTGTGAAYIFSQNQGGTNVWGMVKSLAASNAATGDGFGTSVDIDGDVVVVGAPGEDSEVAPITTNSGAIYLYRKDNGGSNNWGQVTMFRTTDRESNDNLGASVAVDLNGATAGFVIAGARQPSPHATQRGYALLFGRTGADAFAQISTRMTAFDATVGDQFGNSVSVDGNTAVIGAFRDNPSGTESGSAYVYDLTTSTFAHLQKLVASDGVAMDQFGWAVDIDGNNIAVGAKNVTTGGMTREGAVYLFKRSVASSDPWDELIKHEPVDGSIYDYFGTSVAISGCTLMAGAPTHTTSDLGAAYFIDCGCTNPQLRPTQVRVEDRKGPKAEILDLTNGFAARCFPNPTSEMLHIELDIAEETEVSIAVADATGRLVQEVFNGTAAPGARYEWDSAAHPAGLYFVRITAGDSRKVVPISVIK